MSLTEPRLMTMYSIDCVRHWWYLRMPRAPGRSHLRDQPTVRPLCPGSQAGFGYRNSCHFCIDVFLHGLVCQSAHCPGSWNGSERLLCLHRSWFPWYRYVAPIRRFPFPVSLVTPSCRSSIWSAYQRHGSYQLIFLERC